MGDVYLALAGKTGFEKLCVVKRLTAETLDSADRVKRFRREAEIVRTLSHGAIAQTLAVDEFEGEPFIAQEFIEGRNITQLISAARSVDLATLPVEIAVHIVREIARALAYAHGAGVVHRDVAPDNVMVTFTGEVRLIDFGIARAATDTSLTEPGTIVGRWSYTAPEVLAGARADQRADVYAAGMVLWELLTGRPPAFVERERPPAPSSLRPELPGGLDPVVLRAIAADPDARFATAEDLQRTLGPFLPPMFVGEVALKAFVARCYDVDLQRRRLAEEIAEAKALRAQADSPVEPDEADPELPRRSHTVYVLAGLGVVAAAAAAFAIARPQSAHQDQAAANWPAVPTPALAPAPRVPAPAPVASTPPPEPEARLASPPVEPTSPGAPALGVVPSPRRASTRTPPPARRAVVGIGAAVLLDRARDSLRAGELVAAERDARDALETASPTQKANAHLIIGKVLVLRGQAGAASGEFTAALELDPGNEAASAALGRLQRRPR